MERCFLLCNVGKCRKELKTQAFVTSCSHIFCTEHGASLANSVEIVKCPACGHTLPEQYDIVVMTLNPTEQYKHMVLAGLSPELIMDIATQALSFWTYQINQEILYRESLFKKSKEHTVALSDFIETSEAKSKIAIQKLQRNIDVLQKDLDEKTRKIEELLNQLAEKSRCIKNLQSKYDHLKRTSIMNYVSSSDCVSPPYAHANYESKPEHAFIHHKNQSLNSNSGKGRTPKNNQDDKGFVFKPASGKPDAFPRFNIFGKP